MFSMLAFRRHTQELLSRVLDPENLTARMELVEEATTLIIGTDAVQVHCVPRTALLYCNDDAFPNAAHTRSGLVHCYIVV